MFIPLDRVTLLGGHCGKVNFYEVCYCPRQPPVKGVETTAQVDDLTLLLIASLLEQFVDAHFYTPHPGEVAAVYFRSLPD